MHVWQCLHIRLVNFVSENPCTCIEIIEMKSISSFLRPGECPQQTPHRRTGTDGQTSLNQFRISR